MFHRIYSRSIPGQTFSADIVLRNRLFSDLNPSLNSLTTLYISCLSSASIGSAQPLTQKDPPSFYKFDDLNLDDLWVAYPTPETIHDSAVEAIITTEEPLTTTKEPLTTTKEPLATTEKPLMITKQPLTTTEEPETTLKPTISIKIKSTKNPSVTKKTRSKIITTIQSKKIAVIAIWGFMLMKHKTNDLIKCCTLHFSSSLI